MDDVYRRESQKEREREGPSNLCIHRIPISPPPPQTGSVGEGIKLIHISIPKPRARLHWKTAFVRMPAMLAYVLRSQKLKLIVSIVTLCSSVGGGIHAPRKINCNVGGPLPHQNFMYSRV